MKRLCLLFIGLMAMLSAIAQEKLNVAPFFETNFVKSHKATMVKLSGKALKDSLSRYKIWAENSLSNQEVIELERAISKDTHNVTEQEAASKHGKLYYGFYQLPNGDKTKVNSFLFYRNNGLQPRGNPTYTLIYMEGQTTLQELKRKFAP